ncbi:hypothetical protein QOZ89_41830 [Pseudofrankia sp. BMG5.37]|nr:MULTISPECIES: hypothetical protein [unclassified Pseudofrankia]MDT3446072.1 hypothetical protein [Pseudofrankia sp. BMG5.37]OHV55361.1 hypothetical protein BCD48_08770 [Pseudofrankia sp. BMG5.36]
MDHALRPGYSFEHEFEIGLDLILGVLDLGANVIKVEPPEGEATPPAAQEQPGTPSSASTRTGSSAGDSINPIS